MSTEVEVLDKTVQETNVWLKEIAQQLQIPDRKLAYKALRGTLHTVRDHIGPDNAVGFAAQLPLLIRGIYYEGWRLHREPDRERHLRPFLHHLVDDVSGGLRIAPEVAARAVLDVLCRHIDHGEAAKLTRLFPKELRDLWPETAH